MSNRLEWVGVRLAVLFAMPFQGEGKSKERGEGPLCGSCVAMVWRLSGNSVAVVARLLCGVSVAAA